MVLDAAGLLSHVLVELEFLSNQFLVLDLALQLLDLEGALLLLLGEVFQSLDGETNLNELEKNLEVAEEFEILGWLVDLSNVLSVETLLSRSICVDFQGDFLEQVLIKVLWLALSDALSVAGSGEILFTLCTVTGSLL